VRKNIVLASIAIGRLTFLVIVWSGLAEETRRGLRGLHSCEGKRERRDKRIADVRAVGS
jgi:hypothetical protein